MHGAPASALAAIVGLLGAQLMAGCAQESSIDATPWNVVLITLDTTRADALGAYGQRLPTTPHIDRLAAEGVLFEQTLSAAPHTLASHASILTGRYPPAHGVRSNQGYRLAPPARS